MNTLNRNFRIVYMPLRQAKWPRDSRPSSPRVHTKGDHVLEMRRASALDYHGPLLMVHLQQYDLAQTIVVAVNIERVTAEQHLKEG